MLGVIVVIFIIAIIIAGIYDSSPKAQEKYREQTFRNMGIDPHSELGMRIMCQANIAQVNERIRKQEQKKETAEIIKGAVVGGIVAGEAGAVVGAAIAKNKIDNGKKQ